MTVQVSKHGLGFFPISSNMVHNRVVKRVMKKEGDGALAVLLIILSNIYSDKGYYVKVDEWFYDDVASNLFNIDTDDVKRIVMLTVEYDLFNKQMFEKYQILTSWEVQWQYVYSLRRRVLTHLIADYWLVQSEDMPNGEASKRKAKRLKSTDGVEGYIYGEDECVTGGGKCVTQTTDCVTEMGECVAETPECVSSCERAKQNNTKLDETILQNKNENIPLQVPPGEVKHEEGRFHFRLDSDNPSVPIQNARAERSRVPIAAGQPKQKAIRKLWTLQEIEQLTPPDDGVKRNFEGLVHELRMLRIEPNEQYAIVCKSNYGIIGHRVWKVMSDMRTIGSKIKMPGRFILSKL